LLTTMATFAKRTFDASIYSSFRPTYPHQLFEFIFQYHGDRQGARWNTALDLGCGTGQATVELTPFKRVIGVDPSAKMVEGAQRYINAKGLEGSNKFDFVQADAEDLHFIPDKTVDLVVAAQAAHWFDWPKVWRECARVLNGTGTACFWIYSEFRLSKYLSLTPLITNYAQGTDPLSSLGVYWQQPGRSILDNHLLQVPEALDVVPGQFAPLDRVFFTGLHYPSLPSPRPVILHKKVTWANLHSYFRTWSCLHTYHERYPEDRDRPDGDIAARFFKALKDGVKEQGGAVDDNDDIDVEWPVALIMARRVD